MGKAILIVDMPKSCAGCSLCYDNYGCSYHCSAADRGIEESLMNQGIQDWCPLKPMPEKINIPEYNDAIKAESENAYEVGMYMFNRGEFFGYNTCIDKLLDN